MACSSGDRCSGRYVGGRRVLTRAGGGVAHPSGDRYSVRFTGGRGVWKCMEGVRNILMGIGVEGAVRGGV